MNKIILTLILVLITGATHADFLEAHRNALIKDEPTRNGTVVHRAARGDQFALLNNGTQVNGYYLVSLPDTESSGWVYRTRVSRQRGSLQIPTEKSGNIGFDGAHCGKHLTYGVPFRSDQVLCRRGYAIGYNHTSRTPDWVSYHLTLDNVHGENVARGGFKIDREVPAEFRSGSTDYASSGYDRGHMAPSAAIDFSRAANDETFLYSNMAPQLPAFNRNVHGYTGAWGATEDYVRAWIRDRRSLYVIAGTHFEEPISKIKRVAIPKHFFKIIFDPSTSTSISFWMPQDENTAHDIKSYIKPIDFVEERTGFDFLNTLDDHIEEIIESRDELAEEWNLD